MNRAVLSTLVLLFLAGGVFAQWPGDPSVNLPIAFSPATESQPQVVATMDDGCYVAWQEMDGADGDVWLQRLDADGMPVWDDGGINLTADSVCGVSYFAQLLVNMDDNAFVILTDQREDGVRQVYGFSVDPDGQSLWGSTGIAISEGADDGESPRACFTTNGDLAVTWGTWSETDGEAIHVRLLSPQGMDQWTPSTVTITSEFGCYQSMLAPSEFGTIIVQYSQRAGGMLWDPSYIMAQKIGGDGALQWDADGVTVLGGAGITSWTVPSIEPDWMGGAFTSWYDSRDATFHAFVQHISPNGTLLWEEDGHRITAATETYEFNPSIHYDLMNEELYVFYKKAETNQQALGIAGQKLNLDGDLLWGDDGIVVGTFEGTDVFRILTVPLDEQVGVVYFDHQDSPSINLIKAVSVESDGSLTWGADPLPVCPLESTKNTMCSCATNDGKLLVVWDDQRTNDENIYLQNINADGSYGTPIPTPASLAILAPAAGDTIRDLPLQVEFDVQGFVPSDRGGDGQIEVRLNGDLVEWHASTRPVVLETLQAGDNLIELELVDNDHVSLETPVVASLSVTYYVDAVELSPAGAPSTFTLHPAYPNPFNPATEIRFEMAAEGRATVNVYDITGRLVNRLFEGRATTGSHTLVWNAADLPSGAYFVRFHAGSFQQVRKVIRLK